MTARLRRLRARARALLRQYRRAHERWRRLYFGRADLAQADRAYPPRERLLIAWERADAAWRAAR